MNIALMNVLICVRASPISIYLEEKPQLQRTCISLVDTDKMFTKVVPIHTLTSSV